MTDRFELTYGFDKTLWRQAMGACFALRRHTKSRLQRVGSTAVRFLFGAAVAVVAISVFKWALEPWALRFALWGFLAGMVVYYLVNAACQKSGLRKHLELAEASIAKDGPTKAVLDATGMAFTSGSSEAKFGWLAVDGLVPLKTGTAIVVGANAIPIPNAALPHDVSPKDFRIRVSEWIAANE